MQPQPIGSPSLAVQVTVAPATGEGGPSRYDRSSADLRLRSGGRLRVRRSDQVARYLLPAMLPDADLLHPYLAAAAALVWRWGGFETIHGGAFEAGAGAVMVVGGKGAGKSATLAWLAAAGLPILADDLAVLQGGDVVAGPRSIDLRLPPDGIPATTIGIATDRARRQRVTLAPVGHRVPLVGIVSLAWGHQVALERVPLEQRRQVLVRQRYFPALPTDALALLDLVTVPCLHLARPWGERGLDEGGKALLDAFG